MGRGVPAWECTNSIWRTKTDRLLVVPRLLSRVAAVPSEKRPEVMMVRWGTVCPCQCVIPFDAMWDVGPLVHCELCYRRRGLFGGGERINSLICLPMSYMSW